jgi:uncharacterized protein (DUF433 family)
VDTYFAGHTDSSDSTGHANDAPKKTELIRKTPNVLGGDACIRNTRIAVWMIVRARQLGLSDEQIRTRYRPPLTEADLAAAFAYYESHRDEVDRAIHENEVA